jgi:hypothetical protein
LSQSGIARTAAGDGVFMLAGRGARELPAAGPIYDTNSFPIIHHVPPQEHIDAVRPRRRKGPDHRDTDDTQNDHDSRNLQPGHIHEKTPHSAGVATADENSRERSKTSKPTPAPWLQFMPTSLARRDPYAKRAFFIAM